MFLQFDFTYTSDNDFFEYLLRYYAKDYEYSLQREADNIILKVRASETELAAFCDNFNFMANSLFLQGFDVKAVEGEFEPSKESDKDFVKMDFLTQKNSEAYRQNQDLLDNEWGVFVNDLLSFDEKEYKKIEKSNFTELLTQSISSLKSGACIFIKNHLGLYKISIFDNQNLHDFLMPSDVKALKTAFVASNENLKLLASLEKPLVRLKFSQPFRQKYGPKSTFFPVKFANNLFLFALGLELFKDDIKFLSFQKLEHFADDFEVFEESKRLVVVSGLDFINSKARDLILSKDDKNMAKLSYILSSFKEDALVLELSKEHDDILLIDKEINILNLSLPSSFKELYQELCRDDTGKRLLNNFKKEFDVLDADIKTKNNFFSLFGIVGMVLGLDTNTHEAAKKLIELCDTSRLERGVRIDFKLKENSKDFDYIKTVRSVMSFMLAGVSKNDIAYGLIESLAYFLRDTYDELRQKAQVKIAIISGSLFESRSLTRLCIKHLRDIKLSNVALRV